MRSSIKRLRLHAINMMLFVFSNLDHKLTLRQRISSSNSTLLLKCSLNLLYIRGLSQKVVDFLYNKKTIRSIATKFYMRILPLFLHYHANFEGKMSNNKVCAQILPTVRLSHRRTSFKL